MSSQEKYYQIAYTAEIVKVNSKEEAVAIGKQKIQNREVEVDEESTYEIEDEELLAEVKADEECGQCKDEEKCRTAFIPGKDCSTSRVRTIGGCR